MVSNIFLCSALFGEDFDKYFSKGLKPTNQYIGEYIGIMESVFINLELLDGIGAWLVNDQEIQETWMDDMFKSQ